MPTPAVMQPTVKRFIVTVPACYWDRQDGLRQGHGFQIETRAVDHKSALENALFEMLPCLCRTCDHFRVFQVGVARCARRPENRTVKHFRVNRVGRILGRQLRPWMCD